RTALLDMRAAGQQIVRQLRRAVRQNVTDDQRFQFAEEIRADAVLRHIFTKNDQRLDLAALDAAGDLFQIAAEFIAANAGQPGAVGVRVAIGAQQQLVAFAFARDGIREGAKLRRQLLEQPKLFV